MQVLTRVTHWAPDETGLRHKLYLLCQAWEDYSAIADELSNIIFVIMTNEDAKARFLALDDAFLESGRFFEDDGVDVSAKGMMAILGLAPPSNLLTQG